MEATNDRQRSVPAALRCCECGVEKPLTPEFFHCNRADRIGFARACKVCRYESKKHPCAKCGAPVSPDYSFCFRCKPGPDLRLMTGASNRNWRGGSHLNYGYRWINVGQVTRASGKRGTRYLPEHRLIMERHVGRPLLKDESVHHKNGNRSDNRIENLELWSSFQPSGQRVVDKIAYAKEILLRYEPFAPNEAGPAEAGPAREIGVAND